MRGSICLHRAFASYPQVCITYRACIRGINISDEALR